MTFRPGESGNPAGRPKKLLKRIDEVVFERKIEPIGEILRLLDGLKRQRFSAKRAPKGLDDAARVAWQENEAERCARQRAAARDQQLKIWLQLLPYFYAHVREDAAPDDGDGRGDLSGLSLAELLAITRAGSRSGGVHEAPGAPLAVPEEPRLS